jgi:hypothetical protein
LVEARFEPLAARVNLPLLRNFDQDRLWMAINEQALQAGIQNVGKMGWADLLPP